ncbi:MAG: hypothetical protein ACKOXO_09335 [Cyanobium sp.]
MAISTVVDLTGGQPAAVVAALLATSSGIVVDSGSITLQASGPGAVNRFDATTGAALGLGAGVLLTSGATLAPATASPGTERTTAAAAASATAMPTSMPW